MMIKFLWKLLRMFDPNDGYTTPLQLRFNVGDELQISPYKLKDTLFHVGETVIITEAKRNDYLVYSPSRHITHVVYQFELQPKNKHAKKTI